MNNFERSATVAEISKLEENCESFLSNYFCAGYDEELYNEWVALFYEIETYFDDGGVGGWSSWYCSENWNDETLENEADLEIFDLLLKIDTQNGADPSKIVHSLCFLGAFEAVKVENKFPFHKILTLVFKYK